MRPSFDTIARIAGRQHGRISHAQLVAAGVDRDRIKRWRVDGRLHPVHVGVYAVGHTAPSLLGDLMAAALAGGDGPAVSHRSAAHAMRILSLRPARPEITVPTTAGRTRAGIVVHRVSVLHPADVFRFHGIPMTTVPRVLLDLAPRLALVQLTRACHEAWVRHRVTSRDVEACIARNSTKNGAAKLRRALGADATLSELEDGFLRLLRRHALVLPRTNIDNAGDKVDCHWPRHGLTVELLSYRFHASRQAFEDDIARRRRSRHVAYTWGDVFERGTQTAAELRSMLQ
ncbi:MAG TPA: type IV toxin-antitoxin system AbiEi family antitoxin domain-containing protein [Solirubrobacteraceae bacterium]|nr:type IV toxin-antitoxin system AbiEi family antitoxin domain-containing protein [Solirubrobacteraceae bacterium]